ncbi:hypothetical protein HispidOSU_013636 [Sigmodon hispidus]
MQSQESENYGAQDVHAHQHFAPGRTPEPPFPCPQARRRQHLSCRHRQAHGRQTPAQQPRVYWLRERQPKPIKAQRPSAHWQCLGAGAARVRTGLRTPGGPRLRVIGRALAAGASPSPWDKASGPRSRVLGRLGEGLSSGLATRVALDSDGEDTGHNGSGLHLRPSDQRDRKPDFSNAKQNRTT